MFKKIAIASALGLAACMATVPAIAAEKAASEVQAPKVAVVNVLLINTLLPQAKNIEATLNKEFAPRAQELQKLREKGAKISQDLNSGKYKGKEFIKYKREIEQLEFELQYKARTLQEDQQLRLQEEQNKVNQIVQKAIDSIIKERGIDLVIKGDAVAYASPSIDITEEVIKRASADKGGKK